MSEEPTVSISDTRSQIDGVEIDSGRLLAQISAAILSAYRGSWSKARRIYRDVTTQVDTLGEYVNEQLGRLGKEKDDLERELSEVQLQAELRRKEFEDQRDDILRARADIENTRKRMIRENEKDKRRAVKDLVQKLIIVADNFDRMQQSLDELKDNAEFKPVIDGVELSIDTFINALQDAGVESIRPADAEFDPNEHEAVAVVPVPDKETNQVVEVQRTGYKLNDELLRAAQVIVAK